MKPRLKILLTISVFVLLYAAYYWGIPAVVDIEHKIPYVQSFVRQELGANIEIEKPKLKMGLSPAIWLEAKSFSLRDEKSAPLSITEPKIKIRLLPLIIGKVQLGYFSCKKIEAKLKIDKEFRIYVGDFLIIKTANPRFSIENSIMSIENYDIALKDEIQNKNIFIKGDYLDLKKFNSKKLINVSTNSEININNNYTVINANINFRLPIKKGFDTNKIVFDGIITNLNLADWSPYIKKMSKGEISSTTGVVNIEARTESLNKRTTRISSKTAINNFSIDTKETKSAISIKDKLTIDTVIEVSKNVLKVKRLNFISGKMNAQLEGKINRINSQNPLLNLSLNINKSRMEDYIALLPSIDSNAADINISALKRYGYYSDIEGKIKIVGLADRPSITGNILSSNGYIIKPLNIPKATTKITFLKDKVNIDVLVPVGASENVSVKGYVELYGGKTANLDISSTQNVDLKTTESILLPIHEIFRFELGPLPVMKLDGQGNIKLKVSGTKQAPKLNGVFNFRNTTGSFNDLNLLLKNGEGKLEFKDFKAIFTTNKATLNDKPIKIDGQCKLNGELDFKIKTENQDLSKAVNIVKTSPMLKEIGGAISTIKDSNGKINLDLRLNGKVENINDFNLGKTVLASGNIKLLGNNISISNLEIPIKNLIGNIQFKNTDADFDLHSGVNKSRLHIKGKVKDKKIYSKIKLDDIAFIHSNIPVKIFSGNIEINDDRVTFYKVNGILDTMPILIDGFATNIFNEPNFNIYINSKPSQRFIDKYINKNSLYPLILKGDIIYSARITGTKNSFSTNAEVNLQEDSSIYYMGSTIGDTKDPIRVYLDANITKNLLTINNFQYDKLISSQNNKEFISPQVNAKGQINIIGNNIELQNFRVRTQNPTDAKIFNIIFKKPLIKQGQFSSNIAINGSITAPKVFGFLNLTGVNIPLLDTTIKDISMDFKHSDINVKSKGEIFSNQVMLTANMQNRLIPPYIFNNVDINIGNLDINELMKSINRLDLETNFNNKSSSQKPEIDLTNLVINSGKVKAQSIYVKNIYANDLTANFALNERLLFSVDNFNFNAAQGTVNGNLDYNLLNSKAALSIRVDGVNANAMSEALFDLPNQIYGSLTGQAELTCNAKTHKTCMNTLSGKGGFIVAKGKMPKLGSLEYLLKAANLVKSGVTGLTLNSLIDLVTPLKTGQFDNINGMFAIKSGVADDIQIFSKGKDLSIFITGTYNFSTLIANMDVFGRISKKISNVLGPIGNTSLNTLFNTIPGLNLDETNKTEFVKNFNKIPGFELNDKTYRIFSAEIYGDINGDNYVQSFKWVE